MLQQGFQLMLYGLIGVFAALGLFFIIIKLLIVLFPASSKKAETNFKDGIDK